MEVPPDELKARLDLYDSSIMLYILDGGIITTKHVSADDVAVAMLGLTTLTTNLLPENTLWYTQKNGQEQYGLWRPPKIWPVALETKALEPPLRMKLPMPGLVFICTPGKPPSVFAAKMKPRSLDAPLYQAPLFNCYRDGHTCGGTNIYPKDVGGIPESFFLSFFTIAAEYGNRSKSHPDSLFAFWQELDGKRKFPMDELIPATTLRKVMM